ncbi:MAG: hypothetical protein K2Q09_08015 [Phycisphaerales bacterium]|nr:hypothetical protein [Phycisphaerales bacterium]
MNRNDAPSTGASSTRPPRHAAMDFITEVSATLKRSGVKYDPAHLL